MSAFNRCIISGLIDSEPNFNPDGELIFSIIINRKDIPRKEKIHVTIKNKGLYKKAFKEIKKNNFFLSNKAHIETRDVDRVKEIVCPHCSNVTLQKIHGENTLVVIDDFSVYLKKDLETSPLEGINQVYLMGVVCSNLKYTKAANGKEFLKYKISLLNTIIHLQYVLVKNLKMLKRSSKKAILFLLKEQYKKERLNKLQKM